MGETDEKQKFHSDEREVDIAISREVEMSIRKSDWKRVYRKICLVPSKSTIQLRFAFLAWGISIAAFFKVLNWVVLKLKATESLPFTESFTMIELIITIASGVVGFICYHYSKKRSEFSDISTDEILRDMEDVYGAYFPKESLAQIKADLIKPKE